MSRKQIAPWRARSSIRPQHSGERSSAVIVEDDAPSVAPGQMRKTQFLTLLQSSACATADAVLESVGHTTKGCPYIKKWLDRYKDNDAQHLTRAMHKYAPETLRARSAHEAIALVNHRVQRAALSWAKTGKVSDLPEGIHEEMGGGGFLGAVAKFAHSGFGSALLGFVGGSRLLILSPPARTNRLYLPFGRYCCPRSSQSKFFKLLPRFWGSCAAKGACRYWLIFSGTAVQTSG